MAPHSVPGRRAPARLVVLVSGSGSNLQALIDACTDPGYGARIMAVGADRAGILALKRAEAAGIPTFVVRLGDFADRVVWDEALTEAVSEYEPDLVVSAGFMKIVGPRFLSRFEDGMINTHPALLPSFPGAHGVRDALDYGAKITGVTVHLVDSGVDSGPVLAQAAVPILPGDDETTLHERIRAVEHGLLVETVGHLVRGGYRIEGRRAIVPHDDSGDD